MSVGTKGPNEISEASIVGLLNQLLITASVSINESNLRALFEFEGTKVALDLALDGSNFIMLSTWWKLPEDVFGSEVLPRCNRLGHSLRYVKFFWAVKDSSVLISVEFVAVGIEELAAVLRPYLDAINNASRALLA